MKKFIILLMLAITSLCPAQRRTSDPSTVHPPTVTLTPSTTQPSTQPSKIASKYLILDKETVEAKAFPVNGQVKVGEYYSLEGTQYLLKGKSETTQYWITNGWATKIVLNRKEVVEDIEASYEVKLWTWGQRWTAFIPDWNTHDKKIRDQKNEEADTIFHLTKIVMLTARENRIIGPIKYTQKVPFYGQNKSKPKGFETVIRHNYKHDRLLVLEKVNTKPTSQPATNP